MDIENISGWLKGSILGIIVLGAVGSILAVLLLKILAWLSKKFLKYFMENFLINHIKPYVIYKAMLEAYEKNKDTTRLILLSMIIVVGFFTSTILFFAVMVLAGFYFNYTGVNISVSAFLLVFMLVLFGNFWFKDAFSFYALYKVFLEKHIKGVKEIFKDKNAVISELLRSENKEEKEVATKE